MKQSTSIFSGLRLSPVFLRSLKNSLATASIGLACIFIFSSCAGDPLFSKIGKNLSGPIAIAVDPATDRAYVVNSNLNIDFEGATLTVLDMTDPTAPILLDNPDNPISIPELSGQAYYDAAGSRIFITNRFSENKDDIIDSLVRVNLAEAGDFGTMTEFSLGENPFGIACCDPAGRMLAVAQGTLHAIPPSDPGSRIKRSLKVSLASGLNLEGFSTSHVVILDDQAFLSNRIGAVYVINLDELDDTDLNPVDYLITELDELRAIASDGTNIYVSEQDFEDQDIYRIRSINPATVPPVATDVAVVTEVTIGSTRNDLKVQRATLTVDPDPNALLTFEGRLFVAHENNAQLTVIDISDPGELVLDKEIKLNADGFKSDGPFGLTALRIDDVPYLYVTNLNSNNVLILNLNTDTVIGSFP